MRRIRISIKPWMVERSEEYGEMIVKSYAAGENEASRSVSSHGAEKDPELWAHARMGECAACLYFHLNPCCLDWSKDPDPGYDIEFKGNRFDIKSTRPWGRLLIWPIRKNSLFANKRFDVLILAAGENTQWELRGWVWKRVFFDKKQIADGEFPKKVTKGTWYMDQQALEILPYSVSTQTPALENTPASV